MAAIVGAVSQTFTISVIGHSTGGSISNTVQLGGLPSDVASLVSVANSSVQQSVGVSSNATTIALSPDCTQLCVTHSNPTQVSISSGSATTGYLSSGLVATQSAPIRVYFNFTGSFAAITNNGGWVDIIR